MQVQFLSFTENFALAFFKGSGSLYCEVQEKGTGFRAKTAQLQRPTSAHGVPISLEALDPLTIPPHGGPPQPIVVTLVKVAGATQLKDSFTIAAGTIASFPFEGSVELKKIKGIFRFRLSYSTFPSVNDLATRNALLDLQTRLVVAFQHCDWAEVDHLVTSAKALAGTTSSTRTPSANPQTTTTDDSSSKALPTAPLTRRLTRERIVPTAAAPAAHGADEPAAAAQQAAPASRSLLGMVQSRMSRASSTSAVPGATPRRPVQPQRSPRSPREPTPSLPPPLPLSTPPAPALAVAQPPPPISPIPGVPTSAAAAGDEASKAGTADDAPPPALPPKLPPKKRNAAAKPAPPLPPHGDDDPFDDVDNSVLDGSSSAARRRSNSLDAAAISRLRAVTAANTSLARSSAINDNISRASTLRPSTRAVASSGKPSVVAAEGFLGSGGDETSSTPGGLHARVVGHSRRGGDSARSFTVYQVELTKGPVAWTVFRRFSQFTDLDEKVRPLERQLPPLPAKMGDKFHEAVLAERTAAFDAYVQACAASPRLLAADAWKVFAAPVQLGDIRPPAVA
uniref:PX domain-containing protein n=1 Tax=Sexangularia sp. CB-2014 TaxID=1486929 RepID=A0A7S1VAX3_9EUKA|mmetsp:Transcript_14155/g.44565  ORF Transcript_14155/g.44565 Transcript_14155/m.44565 type:complete len:566 (+) Transcript_14155:39-1736(+)